MSAITGDPAEAERPQWAVFGAVCAAYLATTIGESILAPVFPTVADELGFDVATAGLAFGLLAGSIAVGNVGGGYLMARRGPKPAVLVSLGVIGVGSVAAASADGLAAFLVAQVLLGLGSGLFFAPGINVVGTVGGSRRGLAMAMFGIAFSAGLTVAALLSSLGSRASWRLPFVVSGVLAGIAAVVVALSRMPGRQSGPVGGVRRKIREAIGVAAGVGSVGALVQYGIVSFFPAFAVASWDLSAGAAAGVLAAGRLLSVPAKFLTGSWTDRFGALEAARRVGAVLAVTGAWWTLVPGPWASVWAAVVFAAAASSIFPIANLLAFEGFGDRGPLLGTFRSVQLGIGALGGLVIGTAASLLDLRPVLAVMAIGVPGALFIFTRHGERVAVGSDGEDW